MSCNGFACDICKIIFHSKNVKKIHDNMMHNIDIGVNNEHSKLPTFKCSVENCSEFFKCLSDYNRHFSIVHSGVILKRQEQQFKETAKTIETQRNTIESQSRTIEAQRNLLNNKELIINLLQRQVQNATHYGENLKRQIEDRILCQICYERNRNICFRPCRHIYACMQCGNDPSIDTCPMCTVIIRMKEKVYFP